MLIHNISTGDQIEFLDSKITQIAQELHSVNQQECEDYNEEMMVQETIARLQREAKMYMSLYVLIRRLEVIDGFFQDGESLEAEYRLHKEADPEIQVEFDKK